MWFCLDIDLSPGDLSIILAFFFGPGFLRTGTHHVRSVAVPVSEPATGILCYFYQWAYANNIVFHYQPVLYILAFIKKISPGIL